MLQMACKRLRYPGRRSATQQRAAIINSTRQPLRRIIDDSGDVDSKAGQFVLASSCCLEWR